MTEVTWFVLGVLSAANVALTIALIAKSGWGRREERRLAKAWAAAAATHTPTVLPIRDADYYYRGDGDVPDDQGMFVTRTAVGGGAGGGWDGVERRRGHRASPSR
jgi:hypothetical protein